MKWYETLMAIGFNAIWFIPFLIEVIIIPFKEHKAYEKRRIAWDNANPNKYRKQCIKCKYCIFETHWSGRYPNGTPERYPTYCRLIKRRIKNKNERCLIAEPTPELQESLEDALFAQGDVYSSAYGNCYHSTPYCKNIKKSNHIYKNLSDSRNLRCCPLCWKIENNELVPKN